FRGVLTHIAAANMVMRADLSAAKPRKEAFRLVRAGVTVRIAFFMIDAFCKEAFVQNIPVPGFVGMDDRIAVNAIGNCLDRLSFGAENEGERDTVALAHDDYDTALAGLVL